MERLLKLSSFSLYCTLADPSKVIHNNNYFCSPYQLVVLLFCTLSLPTSCVTVLLFCTVSLPTSCVTVLLLCTVSLPTVLLCYCCVQCPYLLCYCCVQCPYLLCYCCVQCPYQLCCCVTAVYSVLTNCVTVLLLCTLSLLTVLLCYCCVQCRYQLFFTVGGLWNLCYVIWGFIDCKVTCLWNCKLSHLRRLWFESLFG
jgi:hypothetical protein